MSGAAQDVRRALLKLAQTWPKDPLRPNLDFGEAIRRATEAVAAVSPRVSLVIKADIRPGYTDMLHQKIESLNKHFEEHED